MIRRLSLLLLFAAAPVAAQSVADYYHTAAQAYIAGENAAAEAAAVEGLALDPNNAKLRALLEKIREQNPDDSGGEQEQEDSDQQEPGEGEQQQNAEGGDEEEQDDAEGGQQPPDESEEGQTQPEAPPEAPPDDPQGEQPGDEGSDGEQPPQNPQGGGSQQTEFDVKPGEMSRADAERILRAIESDELELLRSVQRRQARPRFVEKDW